MSKQLNGKNRKTLRNKMAEVFSNEIKALPAELQVILLDDLVTAFENRLSMFSHVMSSLPSVKFEVASGTTEKLIA